MTKPAKVALPYFDHLLALLHEGNPTLEKSFGRHVHWGYWAEPKQAELTDDDFAEAAENLSAQVCEAAKIKNGQTVLDVGCGFGGTVAHLNENHQNMNLLGLNLDERQLKRAKEHIKAIDSNNIQFQQGNACCLPFPDNSIDVILAVECIFHFPDRRLFFQEAYRVLKPGGYLALSDFVPTKALVPLMKFKLPELFGNGFYGQCNVECTTEGYLNLANKTGFSRVHENDITANTIPTYSYLRSIGTKQDKIIFSALFETFLIEVFSRTRLLKYLVFSFQKC